MHRSHSNTESAARRAGASVAWGSVVWEDWRVVGGVGIAARRGTRNALFLEWGFGCYDWTWRYEVCGHAFDDW